MSGATLFGVADLVGDELLVVKCAACGERIPRFTVLASPAQLERDPVFVLCKSCYVHIRAGYQRDRALRAIGTQIPLPIEAFRG